MLHDASLCSTYIDDKHVLMHISNQTLQMTKLEVNERKQLQDIVTKT